jgi:hypothetical protein
VGGDSTDTSGVVDVTKRREQMIKSIPTTEKDKEKSIAKIIDAYSNIGMIYREQLNDLNASTQAFEELLSRYPENKYKVQVYYQLYRSYLVLGNTSKAEYYKNIILSKHGDTEYAQIILDPEWGAKMADRKSELDIFYEETYRKYLNGEYASVIERKMIADTTFPENILIPKFDLLKTLSIGRTRPLPVFEASLNDIVKNYAADSVKDVAQDILDYIHSQNKTNALPGDAPVVVGDSASMKANEKLYVYKPDTLHYALLIFQNIGGQLNPDKLKNKVSDFNVTNFGSKNLTMQEQLFDHRNKVFILKTFANKQDALQYYNSLFDNDAVFGNVSSEHYKLYVISVNNMSALLTEKKTENYEDFYRSFYR